MSNFHPLEVVDRGSETQFQVGEKMRFFNATLYTLNERHEELFLSPFIAYYLKIYRFICLIYQLY